MQARIKNPGMLIPGAMEALQAVGSLTKKTGLPEKTVGLVHLRASQINGCSVCVDLHARMLRHADEINERLMAVVAWRDAPYFTDEERAALALTEAVTRLNDRADPVPDSVWDEAARHYNEREMAGLVLAIATVNVWNRLNVATRQIAGEWVKPPEARKWAEERVAVH